MSNTIFFTIAFVIGLLASTAYGTAIQLQVDLPIVSSCGFN